MKRNKLRWLITRLWYWTETHILHRQPLVHFLLEQSSITCLTGPQAGQSRSITSYDETTGAVTLAETPRKEP